MSEAKALQVQALCVNLDGKELLSDVSFSLGAGEVLGLLGPNGSGKSTLIRALVGMLPIAGGQALIQGHCIAKARLSAQLQLGFAPPVESLPNALSVRQCLHVLSCARSGDARAGVPELAFALLESFGMQRYVDSLIATLSLGTRQKLAVVLALMHEPSVLVLDEVFNGLDFRSAHQLKTHLRSCAREGAAIVLATHGLELANDLLSELLLLQDGRLREHFRGARFLALQQAGPSALEQAMIAALD
jgi:ABC-2 type transport system ATP-binding protein